MKHFNHTLIVIVVAVVCNGYACAPAALGDDQRTSSGSNMLVNASFEESGGEVPGGWTFEARAKQKGRSSVAQTNAHSGQRSLKLEPNERNRPWDIANNPLSVGQAFPAGPLRGKTLHVSGWLAAEGPAVAVAGLYALRSDGSVEFVRLEQNSSSKGPAFHEDTLRVPDDAKVQYVILNLAAEGTAGAAYFDDLFLGLSAPEKAKAARTPARDQQAEITVDAGVEIRRIPRRVYGTNIEWIWDGNGLWNSSRRALDAELVRQSRDAGFSILRFPGGVFADFYHWKQGVGPQGSRPETEHSPGAPRSVHVFGTDEALAFARETGSELLITVNAGTGTAAEAAEWVQYVNKRANAQRVEVWEIGNELYIKDPKFVTITPSVYVKRVNEFVRAMRAVDPAIKIAAISDENYGRTAGRNYPGWTDEVLRGAARDIDYLAVHNAYAPMLFAEQGFDVPTVYSAMLAAPVLIKRHIDELTRKIEALGAPASRLKLAVTEWGPFFHFDIKNRFVDHVKTLGSALYVASVLKVLVESPSVEIANSFKLVDPLFMGWIGQRDGKYLPTAPYYAFQLFTRHFGERVVQSATRSPSYDSPAVGWVDRQSDVPYLDVVASRSGDGRTLFVLAVNKHFDRPIAARISLRGFNPAADGTAWTLNGTGIDAHTGTRPVPAAGIKGQASAGRFDRGGLDEVTLTSTAVRDIATTFEYSFPAHSVTSIAIRGQ
jgi:alpha-N-arabinofuranosidase